LGPDLSHIGARRRADYLAGRCWSPRRNIPESFGDYRWYTVIPDNFLQVRVTTLDGRAITGARVNEDAFSIQLRDVSGRVYSFLERRAQGTAQGLGQITDAKLPRQVDCNGDRRSGLLPCVACKGASENLDDTVRGCIHGAGASALRKNSASRIRARKLADIFGNIRGASILSARPDHTGNVARLKPVWIYQTNDLNKFETSPIVADGSCTSPSRGAEPPPWISARAAHCGFTGGIAAGYPPLLRRGESRSGYPRRFAFSRDTRCASGSHSTCAPASCGWDVAVADYKTGYSSPSRRWR